IIEILGDRKISISRELTKRYEETFRGTAKEALEKFQTEGVRGEFVLIIEGNQEQEKKEEINIKEVLNQYIKEGYTNKEAVKKVAKEHNLPRNQVYKESLK
ncbi:MAG TPA: 16S rRNA (cytidine(1402)-2'-O)-methyltransferase, partial [Tissierellaceae bacterium]|nr:16S rRNA (cytidine(1402)-2'-O)-methyltransferase [Tissierellaceae bacterium]